LKPSISSADLDDATGIDHVVGRVQDAVLLQQTCRCRGGRAGCSRRQRRIFRAQQRHAVVIEGRRPRRTARTRRCPTGSARSRRGRGQPVGYVCRGPPECLPPIRRVATIDAPSSSRCLIRWRPNLAESGDADPTAGERWRAVEVVGCGPHPLEDAPRRSGSSCRRRHPCSTLRPVDEPGLPCDHVPCRGRTYRRRTRV